MMCPTIVDTVQLETESIDKNDQKDENAEEEE